MYACTAGPRNLTAQAPDLPWACNKEQLQTLRLRCEFMTDSSGFDDTICVPKELAGVHFEKGFGMPGASKSAEYLLLAGPMGKYILEGSMHAEQQAAKFEYLNLLGVFWEKSISEERLQQLEQQVPIVLAKLDLLLPA